MGSSWLPRWAPRLAQTHPGYFKVVLSLLITHLCLGFDALRIDPEASPIWTVVARILRGELWVLGMLHFIVFTLIVTGLYVKDAFPLMRFGCALSAVLFNFLAVALVFPAYDRHLSYALPIVFVALSLSSVAAAKEPEEGPRSGT